MQSSNGHYSINQQVPMVFYSSLSLSIDYVENGMGSCWRKDILWVKDLA